MADDTSTMSPPARRPTVLMYHGFAGAPREDDPYHLNVTASALAAQLGHLRERGWQTLDLDGYLAALDGRPRQRRACLITIDDALLSVLEHGAPVLHAAGAPSVLFAPPALLGATTRWLPEQPDEPLLTAAQLRELATLGMEVGVHGWDHETMLGMTDDALRRNTVAAAEAVADATGRRPKAFAYPYGDLDDRAVEAVRRAGFAVGFSVYADQGRWALSRTDIKPADSLTAFRIKLTAGPHYRVVWRAAGLVKPARRLLRRTAQSVSPSYAAASGPSAGPAEKPKGP